MTDQTTTIEAEDAGKPNRQHASAPSFCSASVSELGRPFYDDGQGRLVFHGDCFDLLPLIPESTFDTIITDPPYGLGFMGQDWDSPGGVGDFPMRRTNAQNTVNTGASRQGGRQRGCVDWQRRQARDMASFQEWSTAWATAALRVAKPGAMLLAFGGTRTHHRLMCAIEDAGWEIRDCMMWLYGSGFPKSLDVSKAIDKTAGIEMETRGHFQYTPADSAMTPGAFRTNAERKNPGCRKQPPSTDAAKQWSGWGTALKPAWEPIIVAMKPLAGTFATNAQQHGVAGLNIDGARIDLDGGYKCRANGRPSQTGRGDNYDPATANQPDDKGRWPANLLLDQSAAMLLDEQAGPQTSGGTPPRRFSDKTRNTFGVFGGPENPNGIAGSSGLVSRFFYTAKASRESYNHHPTVKPLDLMQYLCTLTATPSGGAVLDLFGGSGTTAVACRNVFRACVLIEADEKNCEIAARRLAAERFLPLEA